MERKNSGNPEDERAIRQLVETWLAASKTGDMQTLSKLMADDIIFMTPGQKPFGKEAFMAASAGLQKFRFEGASDIQEIQIFGDWAYIRNHLRITMTPVEGETTRLSGYTLSILRKQDDGAWVLARDANLVMKE
jgi:uncharacterized protein (TIGR02246 family)